MVVVGVAVAVVVVVGVVVGVAVGVAVVVVVVVVVAVGVAVVVVVGVKGGNMIEAKHRSDDVRAPKMREEQFWDRVTAPLLDLLASGPMSWADIDLACGMLGINKRFEHDVVAYLELKGRIHHVGAVSPTWFYGPKEENVSKQG